MNGNYDAIVVGARCAGAATAMLLARSGARVLVLERGAYGTGTLSTHALMRGGVLQLHRWGLLPTVVAAGTPLIRSTTFHYTRGEVTVAIEPRHGVSALMAPRRALLDRILVDAAVASGAACEFGVHVTGVTRDHRDRVNGVAVRFADGRAQRLRARLVIGADGIHSTVQRQVAADIMHAGRSAGAVLYAYWEGPVVDGYHWFYRPGLSVGAIPTNGATCVFVAFPATRFRELARGDAHGAYHRLLEQAAPDLINKLRDVRQVEHVRGFPGHPATIRRSHGPGWALVGDAGYFKDPITAHGITDALRDAELLARAALTDTEKAFASYQATRDDLSVGLFDVTDAIAAFDWDDERLQSLHRSLSQAMSGEVRALAALEPLPCLSLDNARHAV